MQLRYALIVGLLAGLKLIDHPHVVAARSIHSFIQQFRDVSVAVNKCRVVLFPMELDQAVQHLAEMVPELLVHEDKVRVAPLDGVIHQAVCINPAHQHPQPLLWSLRIAVS